MLIRQETQRQEHERQGFEPLSLPDVAYTYTRTGQVNSVGDATGTRQFYYKKGQLAHEYPNATWFKGYVLSTHFQASPVVDRYDGFMLGKDRAR